MIKRYIFFAFELQALRATVKYMETVRWTSVKEDYAHKSQGIIEKKAENKFFFRRTIAIRC